MAPCRWLEKWFLPGSPCVICPASGTSSTHPPSRPRSVADAPRDRPLYHPVFTNFTYAIHSEELSMQIQGSNAIMVGGASGMCRATAQKFVERGGKVAILDLERSDGANVAKSLGGTFHPCNVMDHAGIEKVIGE